jgi:hypothetical protein
MDVRIRPPRIRRQETPVRGWLLAAVLFGGTIALGTAVAKQGTPESDLLQQDAIAEIELPSAGQFISIRKVDAGSETLRLTAKLSETSLENAESVHWKITQAGGGQVFEGTLTEFSKQLPPGEYLVEATYGTAKIKDQVALPRANSLNISFVLNAGALRILSRVKDITSDAASFSKIYALDGHLRGRLIAESQRGGEVLVMKAGNYRIESEYESGNARAVTDVRVKPGVMSAVNINHIAGMIKLTAETGKVWEIQTPDGNIVDQFAGGAAQFVLTPGKYAAVQKSAIFNTSVSFEIIAGQQTELTLGQ